MSTLAERLDEALTDAELDAPDLARALGTNPRTVARWLRRETQPRPQARERLLELIAVLKRLSKVLRPEAAHDWLFTPNPSLDYKKPVDLLREGKYRAVIGAIDALGEGVFV
jgi:putative toxin-antitoxin system antitoxin component (TIGR02293 family)